MQLGRSPLEEVLAITKTGSNMRCTPANQVAR